MTKYRDNHYVPVWYQERFLLPEAAERKFRYLDLTPEQFDDPAGVRRTKTALRRWGPQLCFKERDLYTTQLGPTISTQIEQAFFGPIDDEGKAAVEFWSGYQKLSVNTAALHSLVRYMILQKLRTPKGLTYIGREAGTSDRNRVLRFLQHLQDYYQAIWMEAIWSIADASGSSVKFIVSDHPVTTYNIGAFPGSRHCRNGSDPEPWLSGSHMIFPLNSEKLLILTNTSWVRNPYGDPLKPRPNPSPLRSAVFKFTDIQTGRLLTDEEVIAINYVIKKRANRFIAAAEEEWLYPEQSLASTHWTKLGGGLLFMPDPREVPFSSEVMFGGFPDGRPSEVWDEYGRRPGQRGFGDKRRRDQEWVTAQNFKSEFARLVGPDHRGSCDHRGPPVDSAEYHDTLRHGEDRKLSRKRPGA